MVRIAQLGIAIGLLGIVVAMVGLFPSLLGFPPTPGIGVIQILILMVGMILLILGAILYVRFSFYAHKELTLLQAIGIRISLTGLTFAALAALADILGFGSNVRIDGGEILLGPFQMVGILVSFGFASLGVIIFAAAGDPEITEEE